MTLKTISLLISFPCLVFGQTFEQQTGTIPVTQNGRQLQIPWNGGLHSLGISMPDIDFDGDPDLLVTGRDDGRLQLYRNDGEGASGRFTFVSASLDGLEFGDHDNRLAFDDIDFDGDLDLFVGGNDGRIRYFRNDGDATNAALVLAGNFLAAIDVGTISAPTFADLNGDGLNDLVVGSYRQGFFYYTRDRRGTTGFTFVDTLRDATGAILKPGNQFSVAALVDIDADGDLDLFGGASSNALAFFVNSGSASAPQFDLTEERFIVPPRFMGYLTPVFVDIDGDLDQDLFFGSNHGFVTFYRNQGDATDPDFVLEIEQIQLDFLDVGLLTVPTLVDIDADSDLDLFLGAREGILSFLRNTGSAEDPQFEWVTDRFLNLPERATYPTWGDLDGDDDVDLIIGQSRRPLHHYRNVGSAQLADLDSLGVVVDIMGRALEGDRPELGDIDGDGDLDLFVTLSSDNDVVGRYENVGTPDAAAFAEIPDTLRDENGAVISGDDMFMRLVDLDADDDLDLFLGMASGSLVHFENVGTPADASFRRISDSFAGLAASGNARNAPFLADIDGDSDLDLFTGRFMGGLFFYRNIGEAVGIRHESTPLPSEFVVEQNFPNPFNSETTITYRLSKRARVTLTVFNVVGQRVRTLIRGELGAGRHSTVWNGRSDAGLPVHSGLYFYRLQVGNKKTMNKMLFVG